MKQIALLLIASTLISSCKTEKKKEIPQDPEKEVIEKVVKKQEIKLPKGVVQINDEKFVGNGITLTKLQVKDSKEGNYVYKVFFKTEDINKFQNGDYSLFIQNFPYEEDLSLLNEKEQKNKAVSYWVNLKSAKKYNDEYVVFKSFKSDIDSFKKIVVGVMNLKDKTDVFRVDYQDAIIN